MARARIPVIVLSGRLGSGKTTLLNHLLRAGRGRVGVVVNDFGAVNVDALLVTGHVDAARSITGGCLCCLADTTELDRALAGLAAPSLGLDVVLVEASGLAEPRELARMVISSATPRVRFGGVVEVVDAAAWAEEERYDEPPVAPDHLRVAGLAVLNKTDRVAPALVERLTAVVRAVAPGLPVVRAVQGDVNPDLLYDRGTATDRAGQLSFSDVLLAAHEHDHHHHEHHRSAALDDPRAVDPQRLLSWLESRPAGVYRVKGVTWVDIPGERGRWEVQAVGGWVGFRRGPWPEGQGRGTRLVAIGTDLDVGRTTSELRGLLAEGPVPRQAVTPWLRYVR